MKSVILNLFSVAWLCQAVFAASPRVKDFQEILYSMSSITQVDQKSLETEEVVSRLKDSLPKLGSFQEFNETSIFATFQIGFAFCAAAFDKELKKEKSKRWMYRDQPIEVSFEKWSEENKESLLDSLAEQIYFRSLTTQEKVLKLKAFRMLGTESDSNRVILSSVCASFFSTPAYLIKD